MIVETLKRGTMQRMPSLDHHAILGLGNFRAHGAEIARDGGDAVGLLDPEFPGITDDCGAGGECPGDGENREFVDDIRDLRAGNDGTG